MKKPQRVGLFYRRHVALFGWQVPGRIYRFALAPDFKVQLDAVCVAVAHFGNFLTFFYRLVFFDQQRLVVCIRC